tara:strand:+ start:1774 stop:3048 length:1275 start_codon:yes stop_codon:yes gene_type:complete
MDQIWLDSVIEAMQNLGRESHLDDITDQVKEIRTRNGLSWPENHKSVIRRTLQQNSSDTESWNPSRPDIFVNRNIGEGVWAMRNISNNSEARALIKYEDYSRKEVHDIFDPSAKFRLGSGYWGLMGIIQPKTRPKDFVFFVTYGTQYGGHEFNEEVSETGLINWQSQPGQKLGDTQIRELINHDELNNSIHLFLRTKSTADLPYTYLGKLSYFSHNEEASEPCEFVWQIMDWDIKQETLERIDLQLSPDLETSNRSGANLTNPPASSGQRRGTSSNPISRRPRGYDPEQDEKNRELGLKGEKEIVKEERKYLKDNGKEELANNVLHVSLYDDNAGYDIKSFNLDGSYKYIEVKTTKAGINSNFYISSNEINFSIENSQNYFLYRVYNFTDHSFDYYILEGNMEEKCNLRSKNYLAFPKNNLQNP